MKQNGNVRLYAFRSSQSLEITLRKLEDIPILWNAG